MKRPKRKVRPRWVCIVSRERGLKMIEDGGVGIAYRCDYILDHTHLLWREVDALITKGELEWVGLHQKIAMYTEDKVWAKEHSGPVHTMQLVPPAKVAGRRKTR